ncbi:hypothetical protein GCM10010304_82010 [Streptomyces roseoviolaceus]
MQAMAVLCRTKEAASHIENLVADGSADNLDQIVDVAQAEIYAWATAAAFRPTVVERGGRRLAPGAGSRRDDRRGVVGNPTEH